MKSNVQPKHSKMSIMTDEIKVKRINNCIANKVNFISGTVSPVPSVKDKKDNDLMPDDLESLESGVRFMFDNYKRFAPEQKQDQDQNQDQDQDQDLINRPAKGLTLSIQPKFMGSRINMYIFKDDHLKKSYCITRNGFRCSIPREQLEPVYDTIHKRLESFMNENKVRIMILDGEMLPWSALGTSLIVNEFLPVDKGLETEIELMKRYNFDDHLEKQKASLQGIDIHATESIESTESMYKIYHEQMKLYAGYDSFLNNTYTELKQATQYTELDETNQPMVDLTSGLNNSYKNLSYKPFGILKMCFDDGSESIPLIDQTFSQSEMYEMLRDPSVAEDSQLIITVTDENITDSIIAIRKFFNSLTYERGSDPSGVDQRLPNKNQFEGIVMKPDYIIKGYIPMMKCRNTEYLTIIYGYDYKTPQKLKRLVTNKSTKSKIKQSIKEFETGGGLEMLKINYNEINDDNEDYHKLLAKCLFNEEMGLGLDPRL